MMHPFVAPSGDVSTWHPKIGALHDHWCSIHPRSGGLPGRRHFDPLAVARLLPNIWLVDVARRPLRFRYRLVGTRIVDALGGERTGQWMDEAHPEFGPGSPTYRNYVDVAETGRPSWRRGKPIFLSYTERCTELERIFLPLADDGTAVDVILAMTLLFDERGCEMA